ncbi:hypothetical protein BJX63DRAFT_392362 [Aspergillus granulosus]|uniref:Rad4-domain-containing protein n=1 Tax=Aspergillus granulosus TaxID=176169 RepID=A0ABR4HG58_9EURO
MRPARPANRGGLRSRRSRRQADDEEVPEVYREMLAEAEAREDGLAESDRPRKRFKPAGQRATSARARAVEDTTRDAVGTGGEATKRPQIVYNSPSEESDESDIEWEEVDIQKAATPDSVARVSGDDDEPLQITFDNHGDQKRRILRRKPVTAAEKRIRLDVHKTHLLCLLCHVQRRNLWCNDEEVQGFLKNMLSKHVISQLNPPENKPQHTRSAMFLDGLNRAGEIFHRRFRVTKPGLRRAHWSEDLEALKRKTEGIMSDAELFLDREDFCKQARAMQGSRDLGAQLFCALLRSAAVEARLVCSLQPLPFSGTTGDIPIRPERQPIVISSDDHDSLTEGQAKSDTSPRPSPIRRLGRPGFKPAPVSKAFIGRPPPPRESSYPVFWVEAFNEAFQKWVVIDPVVTKTLAKPHKLEPPATDPYNLLSYVVAFEEDASARDVTRRYTKVFNAKIRKNRVESTKNGEAWWERVLQLFEKPFLEDRDELEIGELTAKTASEPMPRNVQDFKDHPIYALERHLRRNEVIFPKRVTGHVNLGKSGAKGQALEPVYRRSDVHVLRSANKWYRLGRDIKLGEQALKRIPARNKPVNIDDDENSDMAEETALYAFFQTELYKPPPVVQGRIPKNAYGNLDVYVPSMVPPGGVHVPHPEAARAARTLGIDYADTVTGFNFKGRHGTAVFNGIVVASEYREAVIEVIRCFEDEKLQNKQEQKAAEVLRLWRHFLLKLRIAERVKGYTVEGEADDEDSVGVVGQSDVEDMGGGFLLESDKGIAELTTRAATGASTSIDETGGGFLPESDDSFATNSKFESLKHSHQSTKGKDPLPIDADGPIGGGFVPGEPTNNPTANTSTRAARSKYSLIVTPRETPAGLEDRTEPNQPTQSWPHDKMAPGTSARAAISVVSSVHDSTSAAAESPIVVDLSVNDPVSPSIEMFSHAPSQAKSQVPSESVEVLSQNSEEIEGSLLSEDPEDEDAVPEWLMSD